MKAHKVSATYYDGWEIPGTKNHFYVFYKSDLGAKGIDVKYRDVKTITPERSFFMEEDFYYIDICRIPSLIYKLEKEINDYELQKELILIGRNSNPYPYIAEADLMIHPSLVESQGITIIESMALGTPVVAVRSKGPEEFIESGKNGYLVDNNEVDITNLIKILYKEPKKRELCAYNATNIIKQFEPDCIIKKIEELLDEKL